MLNDIVLLLFLSSQAATSPEPILPIPLTVRIDRTRAALGKRLFHEVRLSASGRESCASCHPLKAAGMDGRPVAKRADGSSHHRNTPTVLNAAFNATFNWDGVTHTLEAHTDRVLQTLMDITWHELTSRLSADSDYVAAFEAIYGEAVTRENVLDAIATFERSLVTPNCRFDRFLRGEGNALTKRELQGYELFKRLGCISCHQGVNIGGNLFQKFGVFEDMIKENGTEDPGRVRITSGDRDRGVFRVPSLRNVAVTAPYFHDGREPDLAKAVATMGKAQLGKSIRREETELIVEFLRTLTGEFDGQSLFGSEPETRH
jgi:cytochrome c peroxidase